MRTQDAADLAFLDTLLARNPATYRRTNPTTDMGANVTLWMQVCGCPAAAATCMCRRVLRFLFEGALQLKACLWMQSYEHVRPDALYIKIDDDIVFIQVPLWLGLRVTMMLHAGTHVEVSV